MFLPDEKRRAVKLLRRQIAAIEAPERKAQKAADRTAKRERGKADRGRVREPGYLAFLRRQACTVAHLGGCEGHMDAAHLRFSDFKVGRTNPGKGLKSHDRWAVSLCRKHHTEQHMAGDERRWWAGTGLDPNEEADRLHAAYREQKP